MVADMAFVVDHFLPTGVSLTSPTPMLGSVQQSASGTLPLLTSLRASNGQIIQLSSTVRPFISIIVEHSPSISISAAPALRTCDPDVTTPTRRPRLPPYRASTVLSFSHDPQHATDPITSPPSASPPTPLPPAGRRLRPDLDGGNPQLLHRLLPSATLRQPQPEL